MAVLVNPANAANTETTLRDVEAAARAIGLQIQVLNADTSRRDRCGLRDIVRARPDALFVGGSAFFIEPPCPIGPTGGTPRDPRDLYGRQFVDIGGLMSYGANITDAWRQLGVYTGRILKGTKPADLPVVQATRFELVINLQTARMLGLTIPPNLLALADEVIE